MMGRDLCYRVDWRMGILKQGMRLVPWIVAAVLWGCGSLPGLRVEAHRMSVRARIAAASEIFVGTIEKISVDGARQTTPQGVVVRPWSFQVAVERTIQGAPGKKAAFVMNNYAPGIVQNGDYEWRTVGDRQEVTAPGRQWPRPMSALRRLRRRRPPTWHARRRSVATDHTQV